MGAGLVAAGKHAAARGGVEGVFSQVHAHTLDQSHAGQARVQGGWTEMGRGRRVLPSLPSRPQHGCHSGWEDSERAVTCSLRFATCSCCLSYFELKKAAQVKMLDKKNVYEGKSQRSRYRYRNANDLKLSGGRCALHLTLWSRVSLSDRWGRAGEARRRRDGPGVVLVTVASSRTFYFYPFDTPRFRVRI